MDFGAQSAWFVAGTKPAPRFREDPADSRSDWPKPSRRGRISELPSTTPSMPDADTRELQTLHDDAYAAMARGELGLASRLFPELLALHPDDRYYHYMRGLSARPCQLAVDSTCSDPVGPFSPET